MRLEMYCKGICSNHAVKKPHTTDGGQYESGHKRCSICEVYIVWDGKSCLVVVVILGQNHEIQKPEEN